MSDHRPRKAARRPRRRACDTCHRRKIRCDAGFPQCNWCQHQNLACTYNRIYRPASATSQVTVLPLPDHGLTPNNSPDQPGSAAPHSTVQMEHPRGPNTFLSNITYLAGYHIFSDEGQKWIESQVGERVDFGKLFALESQLLRPLRLVTEAAAFPSPPLPALPARATMERYIRVYSSSFQSLVFPVVSRSMLGKTLDLAYDPVPSFGSASARSCVYAFVALVSLFGFEDSTADAMDCRSYALAARSYMTVVMEEMTVDGLQSLIMLVQLQYFSGELQSAAGTLSIATRLLYALDAHMQACSSRSMTYDKKDIRSHLRDLFWLCYSFDKDLCIRTGQPPCMNDTHCDLSLPVDYVRLQDANLQQDTLHITDHTIPLYPWDLRLSMLKSQVYQELYSAVSLQQSACQLLSSIRDLDETLEQWRLSLPLEFRPTLCFFDETPVSPKLNTQAVMLRLAYYHCVTSIHQASSRYRHSASDPDPDLDPHPGEPRLNGITSSINMSTTACRSTLSYLNKVLPVVKGECFWIILFYAVTAVMTLFCNTLSDPHDTDTIRNVELLQTVPSLIHRIPVRQLALSELTHLQYLDNLTTELVAICMRARAKAQGSLQTVYNQ
ncbi:hypothetical protein BJX61DRAFT_518744 [Aspergillus egyptiacus]|nr:hypothetical protein BJX61DRAFT_518744 [Aspergillus egyptiacus]